MYRLFYFSTVPTECMSDKCNLLALIVAILSHNWMESVCPSVHPSIGLDNSERAETIAPAAAAAAWDVLRRVTLAAGSRAGAAALYLLRACVCCNVTDDIRLANLITTLTVGRCCCCCCCCVPLSLL